MTTNNIHSCFSFNFKSIIIDEIALSGLEGAGLNFLWNRVGRRLSCTLTPKIICKFWKFLASAKCVSLYKLVTPLPNIDVLDRFTIIDEETGQLIDPPTPIDGAYEFCPIEGEYGSSQNYKSRTLLPHEYICNKLYEEIVNEFGDTLVIVATIEERWQALAPHLPMSLLSSLSQVHYCILELVGKGRENGQMTIGNTNLNKIVKESKLLFYNRKTLQELDLIRVKCVTQIMGERGIKSLLLRLKRFHQPFIKSQPKTGKIHALVEYLLKQPDYSEKNDKLITMGYLTPHRSKRLQKTINVFKFEDKDEKNKKYVTLTSLSDESSQSDDETPGTPLKCQYKVGVTLLRQAYERFIDAGLKGLTQVEVAQLLGIEFYTSRTLCRILKAKKLVSEFLEDKGRQRTARYIAVVATNEINNIYAEEKQKLMEHISKNKKRCESQIQSDIPNKKLKIEAGIEDKEEKYNLDNVITDMKVLDGFEDRDKESLLNTKKKPTLRQLKFATGILKIVKERRFLTGYQTLSSLVSQDTGEPPMDTKSVKLVLQKLITDGQLKIFKLRVSCPDKDRFSLFICPPYVKTTDTLVREHYTELCNKAQMKYKKPSERNSVHITRPLTKFAYPRYMKIQKLHEMIIKFVYFSDDKSTFASGFASLNDLVQEMTVEFSLGNIVFDSEKHTFSNLKIDDDILEKKLNDAPDEIRYTILNSKSLHNSIRTSLQLLAILGLIQLIKDPSSCTVNDTVYLNYVFYVNRRAKIVDTSGIWPRQNENAASLEKSFHFHTFDDVSKYWEEVQLIGLNTTITGIKREKYKAVHPVRDGDEVIEYDDGTRFGDGLGPCGFDSSVFIDIPRFWRTFTSRFTRPIIVKVLKSSVRYKRGCKSGVKSVKEEKKNIRRKKSNPKQKPTPRPNPLKTRRANKNETAIKWTKLDDRVLNMLKIAVSVMGAVPGSIKVRNSVAKSLLSAIEPGKLASLCHRRATVIENNSDLAHEKVCIINELRRHTKSIEKYEGLLKVLRIKHYANLLKFIKESKIPMLELLWIINDIAKHKPYIQQTPCVATSLDEFHKKYTITSSTHLKVNSLYRTAMNAEPEMAMLKEAIVMTVMLSLESEISEETSQAIYSVFKMHREFNLRTAIEELRKSGAISAREKILNSHLHKEHFNDIVQSSYKISFPYRRRWLHRLRSRFDENLAELMEKELPQSGLKGSSVVNCLLLEMHSCGLLEIVSVTGPVIIGSAGSLVQEEKLNIIDIEAKYKLKSGLIGWKNLSNYKTFSQLYDGLDFVEAVAFLTEGLVTLNVTNEENSEDDILSYLNSKQKEGCTFTELQNHTGLDSNALCEKLQKLEEDDIILRVGFYDNRVILKRYAKSWLFQIRDNEFIIPRPWLTLNNELQHNVFINWASVIMNKIFECPGSSVEFLSNSFEFITTRSVQDICILLEKCECIKLNCITTIEVDLFSDDVPPQLIEFNPYASPDAIIAFPFKNSLTRYAHLRRGILKNNAI